MRRSLAIVIGGITLLIFIAMALAGYHHRQERYRVVNVGGDTNKCECSKRLER